MRNLWTHTATHLRFFVRNRLLLGFGLLVLAIGALNLVPLFMVDSTGARFEALKYLSNEFRYMAWFYGAGLGLLAVWSHLRARSTTVVFTHPAAVAVWVLSIFTLALGVVMLVHVVVEAVTFGLCVAWSVPYQVGFIWLSFESILETLMVVSMLTALATIVHPVLAILGLAFFNDGVLYQLESMVKSAVDAGSRSVWLAVAGWLVSAGRAVVPMLSPFGRETANVGQTLRVSGDDWEYLAAIASYTALVSVCSLLAATIWLQRKALK